jgi:hypothetical protein
MSYGLSFRWRSWEIPQGEAYLMKNLEELRK